VSAFEELTAAVLPLPLTGLVGRDKDPEVLQEWLAEPSARLILSHAAEALSWYEEILKLSIPPAARSRALVRGALMWLMKAEPARGRSMLIEARALAHSVGDTYLVAHAEALLGRVENVTGNASAASGHFVQAVETFETLGIHWGAGSAMTGWANLALTTDDADRAQRLLDGATAVLRDAGPWFLTSVLLELASQSGIFARAGRLDEVGRTCRW
jgi:hypothetical protein